MVGQRKPLAASLDAGYKNVPISTFSAATIVVQYEDVLPVADPAHINGVAYNTIHKATTRFLRIFRAVHSFPQPQLFLFPVKTKHIVL